MLTDIALQIEDSDFDKPKSDEDIWQMANEEWLGVLSRLWVAFDKPLEPERLTIYRNLLCNVPMGLLELAVHRTIREHKYNSVPSVADVWAAVRRELHNPYDLDQAIEIWKESIPKGIYRFETGKWE